MLIKKCSYDLAKKDVNFFIFYIHQKIIQIRKFFKFLPNNV